MIIVKRSLPSLLLVIIALSGVCRAFAGTESEPQQSLIVRAPTSEESPRPSYIDQLLRDGNRISFEATTRFKSNGTASNYLGFFMIKMNSGFEHQIKPSLLEAMEVARSNLVEGTSEIKWLPAGYSLRSLEEFLGLTPSEVLDFQDLILEHAKNFGKCDYYTEEYSDEIDISIKREGDELVARHGDHNYFMGKGKTIRDLVQYMLNDRKYFFLKYPGNSKYRSKYWYRKDGDSSGKRVEPIEYVL